MELSQRFWWPMRIGELSKRSGLSRDTLRFYERKGLIDSLPEDGSSNNYRTYAEDTLEALEWIAEAQAAGMTLADLIVLMRQLSDQFDDSFDGLAFLDAKIVEVEDRIARSERFLQTLHQTRSALVRAPYD